MQLINLAQVETMETLNNIRAYCHAVALEHRLSNQDWLDWLTNEYRDLREPLIDPGGREVLLDMECFETPTIRFWFRDFLKTQPRSKVLRLRQESRPRLFALMNILAARDPLAAAYWFQSLD